jgi:hypothetical protein
MTCSGASSICQWPASLTTTPSTRSATRRALLDQEFARGLLASEDQHGHRQLGRGELREIGGVLLEGAEDLEAGAHAAGPGIGGGIEAAIGFRDRAGALGGEIVPEMLQVNALAAGDELERYLTVEVEVPDIAGSQTVFHSPTPGRNASMSAMRSTAAGCCAA